MSDVLDKILKVVVGEIVGALLFIVMLIVVGALPVDEVSSQITKTILVFWGIYGIGTPIVIFAEVEGEIFRIFRGVKL